MNDIAATILTNIEFALFLLTPLVDIGCFFYAIWIIYTLFKKRFHGIWLKITIPIIVFSGMHITSIAVNKGSSQRYQLRMFDTEVKLEDPIFAYDPKRYGVGDGYTIFVYALPESLRKRFENADTRLFTNFPKRSPYNLRENIEHWREAPLDQQLARCLDFSLGINSSEIKGLDTHFNDIRTALKEKGTFYAFFYEHSDRRITNIETFIVDLVRGRLYYISHDT